MAVDPFNSFGGYSAGIPPVQVIDANGNVITNIFSPTGNVLTNAIYATSYYYSNGRPFISPPGGSNTQLQYNNAGTLNGIPNVTWNGSKLSLGNISNIKIGGGVDGYFLQTDGTGNLTWSAASGDPGNGSPAGSNTQVQFNNAGTFGAATGFTFDNTLGLLSAPNISVTGNITGSNVIGNFFGDGSGLNNIQGANIIGAVPYATVANSVAGANVSGQVANALVASTVYSSAQPNITSVGTLSTLNVSSNVTAAYYVGNGSQLTGITATASGSNTQIQYNNNGFFAGSASLTFNSSTNTVTTPNLTVTGTLVASIAGSSITGQVSYAATANSVAGANVTGAVTYSSIANSVSGANVVGTVANATYALNAGVAATATSVDGANVTGAVSYASVANSVAGANVIGQVGYAGIANSVAGSNVTGQVGYAGIANSVAGSNVVGQVGYAGVANRVAGANVLGQVQYAAIANAVAGANVTGEVEYSAVANLVVGANVVGAVANATFSNSAGGLDAPVSNVSITGGTNGYVLQTDGAGSLSWTAQTGGNGGGTPGGANTQIQFNNAGSFGGVSGFTINQATQLMTVANANVTYTITTNIANVTGILRSANANLGNTANANYFVGNGSLLTGIVSTTANYANYSGNVVNGSQPNITSLGTLSGLNVVGPTNLGAVGNVNISGGTFGYLLTTDGAGDLSWSAPTAPGGSPNQLQFNNLGTFDGVTNVTWNGSTLSLGNVSNVSIGGGTNGYFLQTDGFGTLTWADGGGGGGGTPGGSNTQVQFNNNGAFGGVSGFTYNTGTGTFTAPNISVTANLITANANIISNLHSGNAILGNLAQANYFQGNGRLLTGILTANYSNFTGTVVNVAQPNITSLGTLTSLVVNGPSVLGAVGNVSISGGSSGYVLSTDGAGDLSWVEQTGGGGTPGGANTQIQFNNSGAFDGDANLTYDYTSQTLSVDGPFVGNSIQVGYGAAKFSTTEVYFATTISAVPDQVLYAISATDIVGVDFHINATNDTLGAMQSTKISSIVYNGVVQFNEYAGLKINGGVGAFDLAYDAGNASVILSATPDSSTETIYRMLITAYSN